MGQHDDDLIWKFLTGLGAFFFVMIAVTVFRGYVLSEMWEWFIVPFGVKSLNVVHAIGLSMIVAFLTYQHDAAKEVKRDPSATFMGKLIEGFIAGNLYTAMMWGLGATIHAFM